MRSTSTRIPPFLDIKLFTIKLKNSLPGRTRSSPETHDSKKLLPPYEKEVQFFNEYIFGLEDRGIVGFELVIAAS